MPKAGKRKFEGTPSFPYAKKAKAASMVRRNRYPKVKGAIRKYRKELKYVDIASTGYAADTTGSVTLLNGIAVGDDNTTRDGRQVTIKSVQLRGYASPETQTQAPGSYRVMVVWDNAVSGTAPTIAQILTATTAQSFPLIDNAERFTILSDKRFVLGYIQNTATQAYADKSVEQIDLYKKVNAVTQYSGIGATSASVQNGGLYLVTVGDTANGASCFISTRVRFQDD